MIMTQSQQEYTLYCNKMENDMEMQHNDIEICYQELAAQYQMMMTQKQAMNMMVMKIMQNK